MTSPVLDRLITSPAFDPETDHGRMAALPPLAHGGLDEYGDALWVADLLRAEAYPNLVVRLTCGCDGIVDGFVVGVTTDVGELVVHRPTGDLSGDPTASGADAAIAYAKAFLGEYSHALALAAVLGGRR